MARDEQDGEQHGEQGAEQEAEQVGSVAEEAAKLFGALGDALGDPARGDLGAGFSGFSGLAGRAARSLRDLDEHLATGAPECTYCPVCRTVHAIRQTSPEVRTHLVTAASSLVQAASGLLDTLVPEQAAERSTGVEHIDLDDDPEEDGR